MTPAEAALDRRLVTARLAAFYLGISTRAFYALVQAGAVPCYRFGPRLTRYALAASAAPAECWITVQSKISQSGKK